VFLSDDSPFNAKTQRHRPLSLLAQQLDKSVGILQSEILCMWQLDLIILISYSLTMHRLPPSIEGEWWELTDESRGGLPYYYQTKTGETVWERPDGFVIPLGIIQVCCQLIPTFLFVKPHHRILH